MEFDSEIWKPVVGYESYYAVSDKGRLLRVSRYNSYGRSLKQKILKGGIFSNGYRFISLRKDRINKSHLIHRLVAQAFLSNPNNFRVVNHIDGNRTNNNVENLEWCTQGYNLKHAVEIGLVENQCKIRRKVEVKNDGSILLFDSMKKCAAYFGFKKGWLHNRLRKYGNCFEFQGYEINVHKRGIDK